MNQEEESRGIAEQARAFVRKRFTEIGLGGDPQGWIDVAIKVLEVYLDYLRAYEPQALRDFEKVDSIMLDLDAWLEED